ncbi:MAG: hypothetical protein E7349_06075 [Clostridiales bacterium]|nr:hypothetical protein [Clostridiales bacterium]
MLKKLLKYDLTNIFRFLTIFYSLAIFFALLTRIFLSIENSMIMNVIGNICTGVTISMIFNILINNVMRFWVRFKQNFYGDESYLTHTLPVEKPTMYLSKALTAFITLFTSMAVITLTLFAAYYSKENLEILKNLLSNVALSFDSSVTGIILAFLLIFFLEVANILQIGFTGVILGHKMQTNKTLLSIVFGFAVYMISQTFVLIALLLVSVFSPDLMNLFITNKAITIEAIKTLFFLSLIVYMGLLFAVYFLNVMLLKQGVNVD